ncbi:MAG: histidine kinase [Paludibacter sp.]|nr:histidine kinase [Paludibacter sp.]
MKNLFTTISIHVIAWGMLLMIPFLSIQQVVKSFIPIEENFSLVPVFTLSLLLMVIFYFNYFVLIPKFLLSKKYLLYISTLILSIIAAFIVSGFFLNLVDFNHDDIVSNSSELIKLKPIIKANTFLMLIISILASIALTMNNHLRQTEKEKLSAQLSSLKSQINPHFLFNTLNNIYATAIDTSPQTADMVEKLSEMMRYSMKETQKDFVPLEEEFNYIDNYIELQKLRFDNQVKLDYNIEGEFSELQIAPMLLIPFIENAFKHGVNSEQNSNIKISLKIDNSELHLRVTNNLVKNQSSTTERSGLGINNTKHRLELIYPSKHLLTINETEKDFTVLLHINLV